MPKNPKVKETKARTVNGAADELYDRVRAHYEKHGTFPPLADLGVKELTVKYHFGSYENLCQLIREGIQPIRRRDTRPRYCRFCYKLLPLYRWMFCPDPDETGYKEDAAPKSCREKYVEREERRMGEDYFRSLPGDGEEGRRKPLKMCDLCERDCPITIPEEQDEDKLTFEIKLCPRLLEQETIEKMREATDDKN